MLRIFKLSSKRFSTGIGGSFGRRGTAAEEHEAEILKEYKRTHPEAKTVPKEQVAKVVEKVKKAKLAKPGDFGSSPGTVAGGSMAGSGSIGKKGAAMEEQWIRKHDQELIEKMKKDKK